MSIRPHLIDIFYPRGQNIDAFITPFFPPISPIINPFTEEDCLHVSSSHSLGKSLSLVIFVWAVSHISVVPYPATTN